MKAIIVVLWRPGDPWREKVWGYCRARWEQTGLPIIEADNPDGLYKARNTGADCEWDTAVFTDADIALADPFQAVAALKQATDGGYVACYTELAILDEPETVRVLDGETDLADAVPVRIHHGSWVGVYAIGRALFDRLGGYDERFYPYSGQDVAIIHAASTLGGLARAPGRAVHLWHERGGVQPGHPPRHPSLLGRYERATGDPAAMRKLLAR